MDTANDIRMGLNCPICLEIYKEPKALVCLHTFCKNCLQSYVKKTSTNSSIKSGVECPMCRIVTAVEPDMTSAEEWAKSLPGNYAIISILEAVGKQNEDKKEIAVMCQPCSKLNQTGTAVKFCIDCQEHQCQDCLKGHERFSVMKGHQIVDLHEVTNGNTANVSEAIAHCEVHERTIEYYCMTDRKLCCSTCAIQIHRQCDHVVEIKHMVDISEDKSCDVVRDELTELITKLKLASAHFQNSADKIEQQVADLPDRVERIRTELNKQIDEFKETVIKEAEDMKKQKTTKLNEKHMVSESLLAAIETSLCTFDAVINNGTTIQTFIGKQKIEDQLNEYERRATEQFSNLHSYDVTLTLSPDMEKLLNSENKMGALVLNSEQVQFGIDDADDQQHSVQFELLVNKDLTQLETDVNHPLFSGMTFLADGRLLAVDNKNDNCVVMDERLEVLAYYGLKFRPRSIAAVSADIIAITGVKSIWFYSIGPDNSIHHIRTIDTHSSFRSISVIDERRLAVGIFHKGKLPAYIVDVKSGAEANFDFEFPANLRDYVGFIHCIYDADTGMLAMSMTDLESVYIFDTENKRAVVINDKAHVSKPEGLAFGSGGCVFVCSRGTDSLCHISSAGEVRGCYKMDLIDSPHCICLSEDKTLLAITNRSNQAKKIQLYRITYDG